MIVGCYSMDLYCRNDFRHADGVRPAQFTGRTFAACKRDAIGAGWRFHRDGDVTCPRCIRTPIAMQLRPQGGLAKFTQFIGDVTLAETPAAKKKAKRNRGGST